MQMWRSSLWTNPGAWYTLLGVGALVVSMWVPWWSADRTARIERRADEIAEVLLRVAEQCLEPITEADLATLFAQLSWQAACAGSFVADLELIEPPPDGVVMLLRNKHYAFQLAPSPLGANLIAGRDTVPAYEVTAWPLSGAGPGHTAYFHPEDGPRAYTRNLGAGFAGLGKDRPLPGACHRPRGSTIQTRYHYRATDDKRWILY
ncbi:MAG: hypothetical protein K8J09_03440 [Planctomycetes bacterium]|nr:hypothetical protein [Planctomycetota bacterium]MCC7399590.1 hypothetical protein [Planctomycetota bacterium]